MTIPLTKRHVINVLKSSSWFLFGAVVGLFFFISFLYVVYKQTHTNLIYEGVTINGIDFGGKTQAEVIDYFDRKNELLRYTTFNLKGEGMTATISAKQIGFGYDSRLLAKQAYSVGRASNLIANMSLMLQAYLQGVPLSPAYQYKEDTLNQLLAPLSKKLDKKPVEAMFNFQNGKVVDFRLPKDGKAVDVNNIKEEIMNQAVSATSMNSPQIITIQIPVNTIKPKESASKGTDMGIRELIGQGTSLFQHSIENRIFNLTLAASRLNGIIVKPGEVFSTTKAVGDISTATGYKQAYVIENGKTVLGDGGGVCQVSTTLFRAALNAGLPIVERHPHAYRVGYYEQDSGPGIDAAIYYPSVDLKFKNDTGHSILIQSYVDPITQRITFNLYGTKDNRQVVMTKPVITSESPAPETLYQDDPTLPKGELKQVDFAAAGANVFFTRTVKKDGKVVISDNFVSNYRPWQAIFLRGTKE